MNWVNGWVSEWMIQRMKWLSLKLSENATHHKLHIWKFRYPTDKYQDPSIWWENKEGTIGKAEPHKN